MREAGLAERLAASWRVRWVLEVLENAVRKKLQKVLDDAAKADQNLASLLLTTDAKVQFEVVKKEANASPSC